MSLISACAMLLVRHPAGSGAPNTLAQFLLANLSGIAVTTPLLLLAAERRSPTGPKRRVEAAILLAGLALVATAVFSPAAATAAPLLRLPYVTLPFMLWSGVRFGRLVPRLTAALIAIVAVVGTARGVGPFSAAQASWRAPELDGFVLVAAAMTLMLAAIQTHAGRLYAQLAERRRFDQAVLRELGEAVIACDARGAITVFNDAAELLHGIDHTEVLGRRSLAGHGYRDPLTRELVPDDASPLTRALAGERLIGVELLVEPPGMGARLARVSAQPISLGDGSFAAVLTAEDITARKKDEDDLAYLAAIVESSHDAIYASDLKGRLTSWNPAAEAVYGYGASEVIGRHVSLTAPPGMANEIGKNMRRLLRGKKVEHAQTVRRRKDGRKIDISLSLSPVRDAEGTILGVAAIARDISEPLRSERLRRAADRRFRRAFEDSSVGMALLGATAADRGFIREVNDALCGPLGRDPNELVGSNMLAGIVAPADVLPLKSRLDLLAAGELPLVHAEVELLARDGHTVSADLTVSLVQDDEGRPQYFLAQVQDVTARRIAEAQLRAAARHFEVSHDLLCTSAFDGAVINANGAWTATLGWSIEELRQMRLIELVHPADRERTLAESAHLHEGGASLSFKNRFRAKDGRWVWLEWSARGVPEEDVIHSAARDVTEREEGLQALSEAEARFRGAFEGAGSGMALIAVDGNSAGRFMDVNDALCELVHRGRDELLDTDFAAVIHPDDLLQHADDLRQMFHCEIGEVLRETRLLDGHGQAVWASVSSSLVRDSGGQPLYRVLHVQDLSERKLHEQELERLANRDSLTDLFNRRRFEDELVRELGMSRRYGRHGAVLLMDVDHFKDVNDSLGHAAGDDLLGRIGQILGSRLRHTDVKARIGGDEFAVILPETSRRQAEGAAASILAAVREGAMIQGPRGTRRAAATIGVACYDLGAGDESPDTLMAKADSALYAAKEAGRDRFVVYDEHLDAGRRGRDRSWAQEIRAALEEERLMLFAQPIVAVHGVGPERFELLLRMTSSDGELIPPAMFLDTAERLGSIRLIDRWVVRTALRILARNQAAGRDVVFHANLSSHSMSDADLPGFIAEQLAATGADARGIVFEITETGAIVNLEQARALLRALRDMGCAVALDDFGAGFASFYNLKHLEFDYLKIDGEFGRLLPTSQIDQLIVRSAVEIAHGLGKQTIVEHVGDDETIDILHSYGVHFAQGFHVGAPAPLEELDLGPSREPAWA